MTRALSRIKTILAMGLCAAALSQPVTAQDEDLPLRRLANADEAKLWQAVGRIDMKGAGFCTGTLITPIHVLTAAHCLFERDSGKAIVPSRISFRAGWRNGHAAAYREARRVITHTDYEFTHDDRLRRVATDIALIELDQPILSSVVAPFERYHQPRKGDEVMVVSYAKDRENAPSLQERCHMLAEDRREVLVYSCDVNYGASGSPIFVMSDARPKIASVVSAMAVWNDRDVALGASLGTQLDALLNTLATSDPVFRRMGNIATGGGTDARPSIASQLGRDTNPIRKVVLPQIRE